MCNCENIEIGSYDNSYSIQKPFGRKNYVSIDKCIAIEIIDLWNKGVETTGCCCGHNKVEPMINVIEEHHNKMIDLGYEFYTNQFNVKCYKPKLKIMETKRTQDEKKKLEKRKPHSFCKTSKEKCTMNYCDDNGCLNRKRELVDEQNLTKFDPCTENTNPNIGVVNRSTL